MLTFSPANIKKLLIDAIETFPFLEGDIEEIEFAELQNINEADYGEVIIDENSSVCLHVGEDDYPIISVRQFIDIAQSKGQLKINDTQSYAKSDSEVYFQLGILDNSTFEVVGNSFKSNDIFSNREVMPQTVLVKETIIDAVTYRVGLFNGFCIFHLLVEESEKFDEYCPSYSRYDYFVRVWCENNQIDMRIADALASAYVFELQTAFNLLLPFSTGRLDTNTLDRSTETLAGCERQMFPLIWGKGVNELLEIYNTAKNTMDLDYKILGFTKAIEYIAPTIAQKELLETVSMKLSSLNVFRPTATYIMELGTIFEKNRNIITKDGELIKLAVSTTVSLDEIWPLLPQYMKGKHQTIPNEAEFALWLEKIAECIYSTRNEIAHAKANYEKRGTECPQKEKAVFANLLDAIAVKCIRWFALQPEDRRVVLK